ncbi:fasciclin domain-containing protein [Loktanella sp. DJP18]|uniref:fasciclin domain-containing protein n=1 Tax=Loktanella sp. DJP18 TaxID=3409788 RepID=UPI003BB4CCC8
MLRRTFMTTAALMTLGTAAFAESHAATMDIVDTAVDAGTFTTLVAAVEAAGLVETLKGEGPFTVFAPTDEAFAALPEGTVEGLLADPEALAEILTYHVVPGTVMAADLTDGMTAATVEGQDVTFAVGDTVMVNDATVTTPDIMATNGVIHVIDAVIMPPAE